MYSRIEGLGSGTGMVGFAWNALREAFYGEEADRMMVLTYETLTSDPQRAMNAVVRIPQRTTVRPRLRGPAIRRARSSTRGSARRGCTMSAARCARCRARRCCRPTCSGGWKVIRLARPGAQHARRPGGVTPGEWWSGRLRTGCAAAAGATRPRRSNASLIGSEVVRQQVGPLSGLLDRCRSIPPTLWVKPSFTAAPITRPSRSGSAKSFFQ